MTGDYSLADLCRILRLSASGLRSCLRAALLSEHSNHYSFQHLVILRTAKGLHEAGVSMRQIRKVLNSLQQQLGEGEALSSLNIYASGKRVVVWDGRSHWQPDSGQFLLNFETTQLATPTTRIRRRPRVQPSHAEAALTWFERAMELQDESPEEARRAYREAIRLRPAFVEAHRGHRCLPGGAEIRPHLSGRACEPGTTLRSARTYAGRRPTLCRGQALQKDPDLMRYSRAICCISQVGNLFD